MNELEKCLAGLNYNCHDEIFLEFKRRARELLTAYNSLSYEQKPEKTEILRKMFGGMGNNVSVGTPFLCDYGRNIYIGDNVSVNMNCTFVDCNRIGDGCWIGGGVIILPGVTIGDGTVIGAGSVVTKDIPAHCVAVGNPCRVIREINQDRCDGMEDAVNSMKF